MKSISCYFCCFIIIAAMGGWGMDNWSKGEPYTAQLVVQYLLFFIFICLKPFIKILDNINISDESN